MKSTYLSTKKSTTLLVLATIISLVIGCTNNSDDTDLLSNDNAIVSFTFHSENETYPLEIYADSLVFNIPDNFNFEGVQVSYSITDNSTINPDPNEITNWSVNQEFVLTAPDKKTKKTYLYRVNLPQNESNIEGFYTLNTQEEVDAFKDNNLKKVSGITINGTEAYPITDLSALASIEEVEFQINVNGFQGTHLNGFKNVKKVTNLNIASTTVEHINLESLIEVNNFNIGQYGKEDLVSNTPALKTIDCSSLQVIHNTLLLLAPRLEDLTNFSSLAAIGGEATLNIGVSSLKGLDNLETAYNLILVAPYITSLEGLGSLKTVTRELRFTYMYRLETTEGCNLESVRNININNCTSLKDLMAFRNITELDNLFLSGLNNLSSLEGLNNVTRIKNAMSILFIGRGGWGAPPSGLSNLDALQNLEGVGGNISIRNCYNLGDFCGIQTMLANFKAGWEVRQNKYNPTLEEVQTNCKI